MTDKSKKLTRQEAASRMQRGLLGPGQARLSRPGLKEHLQKPQSQVPKRAKGSLPKPPSPEELDEQ